MPELNGMEFYRLVTTQNPTLAQRVLSLTGDVANEETREFLEALGNQHIAKPFHLAHVESAVADALAHSRVHCTQ
jgi:CheY-like chemotaxis protein